jgi:hypothetical protein
LIIPSALQLRRNRQLQILGVNKPSRYIYLVLKNLVLWARAEMFGSAENLKSVDVWLAG